MSNPPAEEDVIIDIKPQYTSQDLIQACVETMASAISYSGHEHLTVLALLSTLGRYRIFETAGMFQGLAFQCSCRTQVFRGLIRRLKK